MCETVQQNGKKEAGHSDSAVKSALLPPHECTSLVADPLHRLDGRALAADAQGLVLPIPDDASFKLPLEYHLTSQGSLIDREVLLLPQHLLEQQPQEWVKFFDPFLAMFIGDFRASPSVSCLFKNSSKVIFLF